MSWLSDPALRHLREVADWPDLSHTRYQVEEKIARGGMGTVYRARDEELDRDVALKVLSLPPDSGDYAERMLKEARILAGLEHPGVVPVHDVGRLQDGRVYYTMKLVRGQRLDERVSADPSVAELLRIFARICEAVAFAHSHGVIHRDLKPANVMVGRFGEVLVMDWGVAKLRSDLDRRIAVGETGLDSGVAVEDLTSPGTVLGTPGYMAPEQARGEVEAIDERSDVYSLGAILYFMLTGEVPRLGSVVPPRRSAPSVPRPLEAICLKALAWSKDDRYSSVEELSQDISRFLGQSAVAAYRESVVDRARRFGRKYRTPILLILAYMAMRTLVLLFTGR